jgi:hypothetical protein
MPDLHDFLDDEARRVRSGPGTLGQVVERAERRRRARRLATGALALAVAAGGIGLAANAFRPARQVEPGGLPVPGPSVSASPAPRALSIVNSSATEGAAEFAAALMIGGGEPVDVILVDDTGTRSDVTRIFCHPNREEEAVRLRDRFFPGAELRPRIDPGVIEIRVGQNFVDAQRDLFELFATVRSFMTRRLEGSGAEPFLSDPAADEYEAEEGGLSLYEGVTDEPSFSIRSIWPVTADTAVAVVQTGGRTERLTVVTEDGRAEILDAEQVSPPDPGFEQTRIFVRQFLRARRQASGAGTFLGTEARRAYASHEGGLDLLGYAAGDSRSHIVTFDELSPERTLVQVRFSKLGGHVFEALTVERLGQTMFVIADAERA